VLRRWLVLVGATMVIALLGLMLSRASRSAVSASTGHRADAPVEMDRAFPRQAIVGQAWPNVRTDAELKKHEAGGISYRVPVSTSMAWWPRDLDAGEAARPRPRDPASLTCRMDSDCPPKHACAWNPETNRQNCLAEECETGDDCAVGFACRVINHRLSSGPPIRRCLKVGTQSVR